ncbi:MAG TPA: hypothetical protein PLZ16_15875, partial [Gammaproteobacteria bacterium]|nr:hypothetical protein [Gammaproteobacteria bacterium]
MSAAFQRQTEPSGAEKVAVGVKSALTLFGMLKHIEPLGFVVEFAVIGLDARGLASLRRERKAGSTRLHGC